MTAEGAKAASNSIDQGEKRPVKLAMSRQFLAPPTGNADGLELSSEEVRLANYLDSWKVPDTDGSMEPRVRKMVRGVAGVPAGPLGQRPAWAFERDEVLSSPEGDDVCQRIPAPWELGQGQAAAEDLELIVPSKFVNHQDTMMLRNSNTAPKRGLVSPDCGMDNVDTRGDDSGRRVRFQPRMRDGNVGGTEAAPTLQAGAASVFTVGREPSDECGMFRGDLGVGTSTPGGFAIRQDTDVLGRRGDFEAREDTEVLRMGTGGGFDIREDTEVLRFGQRGNNADIATSVADMEGFEIRQDTEVLQPAITLQSGAFSVREDTEVLGKRAAGTTHTGTIHIREDTELLDNITRNSSAAFGIREDTELLNNTTSACPGAFAVREDTEVLHVRGNNTGVFSIREDTQVLEDSVFTRRAPTSAVGGDGAFDVREDTEVLSRAAGNSTTGVFRVREDTEVLGGGFTIREDTEVLSEFGAGGKAGPSGGAVHQQQVGASGMLRDGSVRVLRAPQLQDSCELAALRAPSGHLQPIRKSGSLPLGEVCGLSAAAGQSLRSAQEVWESNARRKLQFGDEAAPAELPSVAAKAPSDGATDAEQDAAVQLNAVNRASSLLAGLSMELPGAEEFTVLEAEDAQAGFSGGRDNALLDPASSQGRESFLDDEDTENAAAVVVGSGATSQAAPARMTGHLQEMLCTLDDCPEYVIQWDHEAGVDSRPGSAHTSPGLHRGESASLPESPLKPRGAFGCGKPPLSPGKHLQGHSRRAMAPPPPVRTNAGLSRQFGDSMLQSAAATVNPFLPEFTKSNISKIQPLSKFSGVQEIPHAALRTFADALAAGHAATLPGAALEPGATPLGSGGYATVYSSALSNTCIAGAAGERVALKVATPAAAWEFAAARVMSDRVPARYAPLFLPARCIFLSSGWDTAASGGDGDAAAKKRRALSVRAVGDSRCNTQGSLSVLVMPQGVHGTLLDLINAHKAADQPIGDALVLYISLQMLLILHAMQQARVIHTDLKPDNCLLSWPAAISTGTTPALGRSPAWSAVDASVRGSHWGSGCLQAIDFGRAIDLQLLPAGTQFDGVSTTEGMQCPEMLSGKAWHFCHDAFCVAATIHAVLLGKYIAVQRKPSLAGASSTAPASGQHKPVYCPTTSVPSSNSRKPLWDRLFRTLLNCPLAPERPDFTPLLAEFTSALETAEAKRPSLWLEMAKSHELTASFLARRRAV